MPDSPVTPNTRPLTADDLRAGVIATLREVAPEIDPAQLATDRPLRRQVDLDSMDWLRVILGWHERFGVDIPEADYGRLVSVEAVVGYLERRQGSGGHPPGPRTHTRPAESAPLRAGA